MYWATRWWKDWINTSCLLLAIKSSFIHQSDSMKILWSRNGIFLGYLQRILLKGKNLTQSALNIKYSLLPGKENSNNKTTTTKPSPFLSNGCTPESKCWQIRYYINSKFSWICMFPFLQHKPFRTSKFLTPPHTHTHLFNSRIKSQNTWYKVLIRILPIHFLTAKRRKLSEMRTKHI